MKRILSILLLLFISLIFINWGGPGHKLINESSVNDFPDSIAFLKSWQKMLSDHASDADNRKGSDPSEGPKHYIDIDAYPEFISNNTISYWYDSLVLLHGKTFVDKQGTLPWATLVTFDSLKSCFKRKDMDKAVLFAADLGHYIADGHMPLHITKNYDGQLSGQGGIHSRYESKMISTYLNNIEIQIKKGIFIGDVRSFVFEYLINNYEYVDSVLQADLYAKNIAGSTSSTQYYDELWKKTSSFTGKLYSEAASCLASLIYTAWFEAEHPVSILYDLQPIRSVEVNNPVHRYIHLKIDSSPAEVGVKVELMSLDMQVDTLLYNNLKSKGSTSIALLLPETKPGIYLLRITTGTSITIKKLIII